MHMPLLEKCVGESSMADLWIDIRADLFPGIKPMYLLTFATVALLLSSVALLATCLPGAPRHASLSSRRPALRVISGSGPPLISAAG